MYRIFSFGCAAVLAVSLVLLHPDASSAAGQAAGQESTAKKKSKEEREKSEKKDGAEELLEEEFEELKDADYPDLVPAGEESELADEFDELKEDDYPDLVGKDETGEIMDEFSLLREEEIIYTAAKHEQDIAESPSAITVINREQIENTACMDVICLLRQVPEINVRRIMPAFASVGARALTGETGDKVLALVDGMEVNDETYGCPHWASGLPVTIQDIERIEVIRGPGSALYGANAHSAVISITTRRPEGNKAEAFISGGEQGSLGINLSYNQRLDSRWHLNVTGSRDTSGDWRLRGVGDLEANRVRLRVTRETDSATSNFQAGMVASKGRLFTKLGGLESTDLGYFGHLILSHRTDPWKARVYFRAFDADLSFDIPLYFKGIELGKLPEKLEILIINMDAEFQLNWSPWEGNLLIGGGNYRLNNWSCKQNDPVESNEHRLGVFIQDEQRLFDALILTGGVRFDWNSISPIAVSPRVAAVWRFVENNHLRLAFGTAFKKPAAFHTSIHITGVEENVDGIADFIKKSIGNKKLGNERVTSFEAGYMGRFLERRLVVEADVFYNRFRDTFAFHVDIVTGDIGMPDLGSSKMEFRNEGMDVDSVGGSISLTCKAMETLRLSLNYTYRYSWYVSEPTESSALIGKEKGSRVAWEPSHNFNASMHYIHEAGLRLGAGAHAVSSMDAGWTEGGSPFGESIMLHIPSYCFVNGFIAYRQQCKAEGVHFWEVGLRVYNVFHAGFRDSPAVIQSDGTELGGQLIGRRIFLFLRASI